MVMIMTTITRTCTRLCNRLNLPEKNAQKFTYRYGSLYSNTSTHNTIQIYLFLCLQIQSRPNVLATQRDEKIKRIRIRRK